MGTSDGGGGSGCGVSSTVECFPVVQGGIERNSSKVRTRGLQHFQPVVGESAEAQVGIIHSRAPRHLSALHGIPVVQGGSCSPLPDL